MFLEEDIHYRGGFEAGLSYLELNGGLEDAGMPDPVNPYTPNADAAQHWERGFFAGYEQACELEELDRWTLDN